MSVGIGEIIKNKRQELGYTQKKLSEELLISRSTVSSWETGRTYPDLSMLVLLSSKFNVSVDYLLKGDADMVKDIDKQVRRGRKFKYVVTVLVVLVIMIGIYFLMWNFKVNKVYGNVKNWEDLGTSYISYDEDISYSVTKVYNLDIRTIPDDLGIVLDRSNDFNGSITMYYVGNDDEIVVSFWTGELEGIDVTFNKDFVLESSAENDDSYQRIYSDEISSLITTELKNNRDYLLDSYKKIKSQWEYVNNYNVT